MHRHRLTAKAAGLKSGGAEDRHVTFLGVNKGIFNTMVQKLNFRVHLYMLHARGGAALCSRGVCNTQSNL